VGTKVGNLAPQYSLRLTDGKKVDSAELISQGKPAFLFFFATW
jgi:peroxiredoxin